MYLADYEVEKIIKARKNKQTSEPEYWIKWKGFTSKNNTWYVSFFFFFWMRKINNQKIKIKQGTRGKFSRLYKPFRNI